MSLPVRSRLKEALDERGKSVADLKRDTGLSYPTLLDLVHNRSTRVDFNTLFLICRALHPCQVNQILEYVPDP